MSFIKHRCKFCENRFHKHQICTLIIRAADGDMKIKACKTCVAELKLLQTFQTTDPVMDSPAYDSGPRRDERRIEE